MSFAVYHMLMIILHQRRILPDCLPGSFDKQDPEEVITSKGYSASVSSFLRYPVPWGQDPHNFPGHQYGKTG